MERSIFAALIADFSVSSALGGWLFVGSVPSPRRSAVSPEGEWRLLDPVTYEISLSSPSSVPEPGHSAFLTLEEGLAAGEVTVAEQGAQVMQRSRDGAPSTSAAHYRRFRQTACSYQSQQAPAILLAGELAAAVNRIASLARTASFPSARLRFLLMSSVSNTGVGPAARNLRLQNYRPSQRSRKSGRRSKTNRGLGRSSRRHHSQSGPAAPPPQISTPEYSRCYRRQWRTEAYEKIYEFASRRGFHR